MDIQVIFPLLLIYCLFGYAFVITVPSLLDRSISIYMIAVVAQSGAQGASESELQYGFQRDYVDGNATIAKRLNEQLVSRHFVARDGRYFITPKGQFVYDTNRFLARLFLIPPKYTEPPQLVTSPKQATSRE